MSCYYNNLDGTEKENYYDGVEDEEEEKTRNVTNGEIHPTAESGRVTVKFKGTNLEDAVNEGLFNQDRSVQETEDKVRKKLIILTLLCLLGIFLIAVASGIRIIKRCDGDSKECKFFSWSL